MEWKIIKGTHVLPHPPLRWDDEVTLRLCTSLPRAEVEWVLPVEGAWGYEDFQWKASQLVIAHHTPTNRFWTHDWSDSPQEVARLAKDERWRGSWLGMCWKEEVITAALPPGVKTRCQPGWNAAFYPSTVEAQRVRVGKSIVPSQFLWAGTVKGLPRRQVALALQGYKDCAWHGWRLDQTVSVRREEWVVYASQYGAVLCLPGGSVWCNREVDCWGVGVPSIVLPHGGRLQGDPAPWECWISPPVAMDATGNVTDDKAAAEVIMQTWQEVRQDATRLKQMVRQARQYYEAYCTPQQIAMQLTAALQKEAA